MLRHDLGIYCAFSLYLMLLDLSCYDYKEMIHSVYFISENNSDKKIIKIISDKKKNNSSYVVVNTTLYGQL